MAGQLAGFFMPIAAILMLTICFIVAAFAVGLTVSHRIRHAGFTTLKAWRTVFKFAGAMTSVAAAYASAPPTWAPSGTGMPTA